MQQSESIIIMASMLEADPFIKNYPLQESSVRPFREFTGSNLHLIISGIGKVCAASASSYALQKYHAKKIINLGAAGALNAAFQFGDIFEITRLAEYDAPDVFTKKHVWYTPRPHEDMAYASLITRDIPVITASDRQEFSFVADLADMEAAAIGRVCSLFDVEFGCIKIVSDTVMHDHEPDIVKNIKICRMKLYEFIYDKNHLL